jgi:hypothetical protein
MLGPTAFARNGGHTGTIGFHGPTDFSAAQTRPSVVRPQSRKSYYRRRLRPILQLGHDYDLVPGRGAADVRMM